MKNKHLLLILGLFIFSFAFVSPTQFPTGYTIVGQENDKIKQNEDLLYSVFVYDSDTGVLEDNSTVSCRFFLADSQGYNLFAGNMTYEDGGGYTIEIGGGNFSEAGFYSYGVNCHNAKGGTDAGIFEVTPSGSSGEDNIAFYIIIIVLGYSLSLLGFFNRNSTITILGGIILIFVGLFMIQNGVIIFRNNLTLAISYITLIWGSLSAVWAAVEEIEGNI